MWFGGSCCSAVTSSACWWIITIASLFVLFFCVAKNCIHSETADMVQANLNKLVEKCNKPLDRARLTRADRMVYGLWSSLRSHQISLLTPIGNFGLAFSTANAKWGNVFWRKRLEELCQGALKLFWWPNTFLISPICLKFLSSVENSVDVNWTFTVAFNLVMLV